MSNAPISDETLAFIKACISSEQVRWTYHVTMRLQERRLTVSLLRKAVDTLEIIEKYPSDKYLPSFLLRGEVPEFAFHALVATDLEGENIRVVTMYGWAVQESPRMKCRVCAGAMDERTTDLPFRIADTSIVIVKSLPVFQCRQCGEVELGNVPMSSVDRLLATVVRSAELEVVRYAA